MLLRTRPDHIVVSIPAIAAAPVEANTTSTEPLGSAAVTGPRDLTEPVNSVFPVWDALTGMTSAVAILAAERHRRLTGEGQLVELALSDVAFAMTGHLGRIAQAQLGQGEAVKDGNHLYGAFGADFEAS